MSTATIVRVGGILHDATGSDFAEDDVDNRYRAIHDVPMQERRFCSSCFPEREKSAIEAETEATETEAPAAKGKKAN